jgi:hypothetical protein
VAIQRFEVARRLAAVLLASAIDAALEVVVA